MFEFSPIHSAGVREFTISADGIKQYFPIVKSLVSKAPHINKWKINAFRQRVPGEYMAIEYNKSIKISYNNIYFRYVHDSDKIALELNVENLFDSPNFKHAGAAAFMVTRICSRMTCASGENEANYSHISFGAFISYSCTCRCFLSRNSITGFSCCCMQ